MPEPEQELSRAELKRLADAVLNGEFQKDADAQKAKNVLEAHGIQHPYTSLHDDADKSVFQREIAEPVETFADHYIKSFTAGVVPHMTEAPLGQEQQAEIDRKARHLANPTAATLGTFGGYMSPGGVGGLLSRGVGAATRLLSGMAPRIAPASLQLERPTASFAKRMATAIPVGIASDVALTTAERGVAAAKGQETGDWADELTRAVMLGAFGGAVGELVSSAGQAAYHGMRETPKFMPHMRHLEAGGGGPRVLAANLEGLGKPKGFDEMMRRAQKSGAGSATEAAADVAAPHVGRAIGETDAAVKARQEAFNEAYYASPEGRAGQGSDELLDEIMVSYDRYKGVPFEPTSDVGKFLGAIKSLSEVRVVPKGGTRPEGGHVYKLPGGRKSAEQLIGPGEVQEAITRHKALPTGDAPGSMLALPPGAPPSDLMRRGVAIQKPGLAGQSAYDPSMIDPNAVPSQDPEFDFFLVPKRIDAKTLDTTTRLLESLKKKDFPDAARIQQAAYRVRDKFPGNDIAPNPAEPEVLADGTVIDSGWGYAKRKQTRELDQLEAVKKVSGLRSDESIVDVPLAKTPEAQQVMTEQVRRIAKGIQGYGAEGTGRDVRFVQKLLEDNPEGAKAFRRFMATKGYEKVREAVGAKMTGGMSLPSGRAYQFMTGLGDVLKMRMDPLARQAMKVTPELGGRLGVPIENLQLLESLLRQQEE